MAFSHSACGTESPGESLRSRPGVTQPTKMKNGERSNVPPTLSEKRPWDGLRTPGRAIYAFVDVSHAGSRGGQDWEGGSLDPMPHSAAPLSCEGPLLSRPASSPVR